jgi:hypothetical protein
MSGSRTVRYIRCDGPGVKEHPPGAEAILVRIEREDQRDSFGGYVVLDAGGAVIEKSSDYGIYEGDASGFVEEEHCVPASRQDFEAAWQQPYARRSLMRRFLSSLNGADDRTIPDDDGLEPT